MLYDASLTPKGIRQANKAKVKYAELIQRCDLIICSPFTRAIETMKIIFEESKCPVIITPLARERLDTSCDIGTPLSELKQKYKDYEYMHFDSEY